MFDVGPEKILLILAAALVFLGPRELPAAAKKLAAGVRQLRSLQDTVRGEVMSVLDVGPTAATRAAAEPASTTAMTAVPEPPREAPSSFI